MDKVSERIREMHGMSGSKEHKVWENMKARCDNPNFTAYEHYGKRGITYCAEWKSFMAFYRDMGPCPTGYTLDRINNNLGYSKENCRWTSQLVQQNNRSNTKKHDFRGVLMTLMEASRTFGVSYRALRYRILKRGWDTERAITTPVRSCTPKAKPVCVEPSHVTTFDHALSVAFRTLAQLFREAV